MERPLMTADGGQQTEITRAGWVQRLGTSCNYRHRTTDQMPTICLEGLSHKPPQDTE